MTTPSAAIIPARRLTPPTALYDTPSSSTDSGSSGKSTSTRPLHPTRDTTHSLEHQLRRAPQHMQRGFRKRASFGSLGDIHSTTSSEQIDETEHKHKMNSNVSVASNNSAKKNLEFHHFSKHWVRRRHPVIALTAVFMVVWACWTTVITLQHFQPSVDPLSIMLDPTGTSAAVAAASDLTPPRSLAAPLIRGTAKHSIPLPLPKQKISVVLMNFSRPRMIRESSMMRTLLSHPNVDEVLLLHANPKTAFEFVHPKVTNIDAIEHNNEMGLSLRFYFCQIAKNDWVLHLDDDMEFTTEALNELIIEYERNPKRIVGRFGRDMTPGNSFNGYNSKDRHKSTEVVLTKLMLMERNLCSAFFEYAHLVWNDVILHNGEGPLWNGEDIFMSLVANHEYDKPKDGSEYNNYAMDWLNVWQADDSLKDYDNGKYDISGGMKGVQFWNWRWWQTLLKRNRHYSYRGGLWKIAKDRLKELSNKQTN